MSKQTDLINVTDAITVSGSNVGIGTTAPKRHLHLNNSAALTTKIQITNLTTGSATDGDGFQLGISNDGTANIEQRENLDMAFTTNNTERMRIDAAGRVTTPYQPSFHVYNTTNGAFTLAAGAYYPFNAAVSNVGNSFNTSTHGFTAPVDGNYSLDFSTITNSNQHNIHLDFAFSGNSNQGTNYHWSTHSSNWQSLSMSGVYYMSAGVSVRVRNNSLAIGYHGGVWNKFTGYLLG